VEGEVGGGRKREWKKEGIKREGVEDPAPIQIVGRGGVS